MDNIRYYATTPKNQRDNINFEEIYTKAGYRMVYEILLLTSTSPDRIEVRKIDSREYDKKIKEFKSRGRVDIKEINESTYMHRRQRLEEKVHAN